MARSAASRTAAARASLDEVRAWRRAAAARGLSTSSWLREVANRVAAGDLVDRELELLHRREISRLSLQVVVLEATLKKTR